ncbi:MAG: exodeoxyribonuclease VII large subunit [Gammaproteobacteria bacterium]
MTIDQEHIYSVSELNQSVKRLLEQSLGVIWLEGEISNFVCPQSGHWYFSLKDDQAQIRSAMFRMQNRRAGFFPEDGQLVRVLAKPSVYTPRGDFQLIIEAIEVVGDGGLQKKFEELKSKLAQEGLFDESFKKPIPLYPQAIGVVTSATGAAIRDILHVTKRRFPSANIFIYPTLVQGDQAATAIVKAIQLAEKRQEVDVLIVARGGGSLEDLWPFNEEVVARAIFACNLPIISGVGHEIDFTISDFVADYRAPTPSAAAESVCPNRYEIARHLQHVTGRLQKHMLSQLKFLTQHIKSAEKRLHQQHPQQQLQQQSQQLDQIQKSLMQLFSYHLKDGKQALVRLSEKLNALSPLSTLARGYAIVTDQHQKTIKSDKQVKPGDTIHARLHEGQLVCEVIDQKSD